MQNQEETSRCAILHGSEQYDVFFNSISTDIIVRFVSA